jgi:serine/threonine protein kinase
MKSKWYLYHPLDFYGSRISEVGDGVYGAVYRYESADKSPPKPVAVKIHRDMDCALREISVLLQVSHPNIVRLMDVGWDSDTANLYQVMEYASITLYDLIRQSHYRERPQAISTAFRDILSGLDHLHHLGYVHRDLKPENILVAEGGSLKLCDFGMTRQMDIPGDLYTSYVITLYYRPPENILEQNAYGKSVDLWSAGCIFAEMILDKPLFDYQTSTTVLKKQISWLSETCVSLPAYMEKSVATISRSYRQNSLQRWKEYFTPRLKEQMGEIGYELLLQLLHLDPEKRLSARQALQHSYFSSLPAITTEDLHQDTAVPSPPVLLPSVFEKEYRAKEILRLYDCTMDLHLSSRTFIHAWTLYEIFRTHESSINGEGQEIFSRETMNLSPRNKSFAKKITKRSQVSPKGRNEIDGEDSYGVILFLSVYFASITCEREPVTLEEISPYFNMTLTPAKLTYFQQVFLSHVGFQIEPHTGYDWFWNPETLEWYEEASASLLDSETPFIEARAMYRLSLLFPNLFYNYHPARVAETCLRATLFHALSSSRSVSSTPILPEYIDSETNSPHAPSLPPSEKELFQASEILSTTSQNTMTLADENCKADNATSNKLPSTHRELADSTPCFTEILQTWHLDLAWAYGFIHQHSLYADDFLGNLTLEECEARLKDND